LLPFRVDLHAIAELNNRGVAPTEVLSGDLPAQRSAEFLMTEDYGPQGMVVTRGGKILAVPP
jgi:hypothetical protein